jgi:hypothetical protein
MMLGGAETLTARTIDLAPGLVRRIPNWLKGFLENLVKAVKD